MSKSRETTPTIPNIRSTSTPTTSRLQAHEEPRPEQSVTRNSPTRSSSPTPVPETRPMARRLRRESSDRSSPSSDSQDGMADTEEGPPLSQPETSHCPPPKKKRTRTLTTPHQSAVLHALLAQSRFPTTAMREEVGRSIGLSARKVQIWFQNQRQKAKRPRSGHTSSSSSSAPPTAQYGPGPSTSQQHAPVMSWNLPSEQTQFPYPDRMSDPGAAPSGQPSASFPIEPPIGLSGPGIPGPERRDPYRRGSHTLSPIAGPSRSTLPPRPEPYPLRSPTSPRLFTHQWARRATSYSDIERDSRTLPPLMLPPASDMASIPPPQRSAPAIMAPLIPRRSSSPQLFAHHVPSISPPASTHITSLPPPFTLQPPPQWDPSHYTSLPSSAHSTASSWLRQGSSVHEGSVSPISPLRRSDDDGVSSRSTRYESIRRSRPDIRPRRSPPPEHEPQ